MAKEEKRSTLHERKTSLDSIKLLMQKSPSRAKNDLLRHLEKYPKDMYAWHYYGKIAQEEYNFEEAKFAFRKVAESKSWNKYAGIVGLGDVARNQGDRFLAKKYYQQAIYENPNEIPHTFCMLARMECLDGNHDEALRILEMAQSYNNEIALEQLRVYVLKGDEPSALAIAESITPKTDNERRIIAYEKAKLAIQNKRTEEAKNLLAQAKENKTKSNDYYKVLNTEANLALDLRDYELAIKNCEEALRDGKSIHGDIYVTYGRIKQLQGKYQEALDNYYLALNEPGASQVTKMAASLYASTVEMAFDNEPKAEELLKESLMLQIEPYEATIDVLCGIYYRQGKYQEIKDIISKYSGKVNGIKLIHTLKFLTILVNQALGEELPQKTWCTYRARQVIDYSKSEAIEHIISHHQGTDSTAGNFASYIDVEKIYDEMLLQLNEETKVPSDTMDKYVIDYPNAGYTPEGEITHSIGVVTLPGTFKIVTMYPNCDSYIIRKSDVRKYREEQNAKKNKNSRIEKFNSRYANFVSKK